MAGDVKVRFGQRHLGVVHERVEKRPLAVHLAQLFQAVGLFFDVAFQRVAEAVPGRYDEP